MGKKWNPTAEISAILLEGVSKPSGAGDAADVGDKLLNSIGFAGDGEIGGSRAVHCQCRWKASTDLDLYLCQSTKEALKERETLELQLPTVGWAISASVLIDWLNTKMAERERAGGRGRRGSRDSRHREACLMDKKGENENCLFNLICFIQREKHGNTVGFENIVNWITITTILSAQLSLLFVNYY